MIYNNTAPCNTLQTGISTPDWSFSSPRVCRGSSPQLGQHCPWPLKSSSRGARTRRAKLKSAAMLLPIRSAKNGKQRYFYCTYKPFRNHFKNADKASLRGDFCKHVGLCLKADNLQTSIVVLISANMQTANIIKPSLFNTKDEEKIK